MTELSYAAGPTDTPLLDETIGQNLARTVDTHVRRLREKLGAAGGVIETVRGVGYRVAG